MNADVLEDYQFEADEFRLVTQHALFTNYSTHSVLAWCQAQGIVCLPERVAGLTGHLRIHMGPGTHLHKHLQTHQAVVVRFINHTQTPCTLSQAELGTLYRQATASVQSIEASTPLINAIITAYLQQ